ncbi:MAG TPA: NAD-dependent epimerase/dehydratase family protein, partial [Bryobacteraceae bacterium]|nr:NAD-dependent epimerase/dehydratase family protein [Bryobacteraceae bacterium]
MKRPLAGKDDLVLVTGGGGFIGGAMVAELRRQGCRRIRAVDVKPLDQWYQVFEDADNLVLDLNLKENCEQAAEGAAEVYNFAANMGGMGFIENNKALCMLSVLINTHMLQAAQKFGVRKFFYSSSACVYNGDKQTDPDNPGLKEEDAYPALAEDGYGWEKLFSERMCRHFAEDYGMYVRVARFHNVYGPYGTWDGGREKAPAAICRKVIQAKLAGDTRIVIWGDGQQTRSFTYISDCLEGTRRLMESGVRVPLNIGSSEMVSI